jgi:glycyl-tRNA synthetase beta chain
MANVQGELLLEILTEEIPAHMQREGLNELQKRVREFLGDGYLQPDEVDGFVTPRRLAIIATGIPLKQPDFLDERRGPRLGAPEAALAGFVRSAGVATSELFEKNGYYYAEIKRIGRSAKEVLPDLISEAVMKTAWRKSMRFPAAPIHWVRPINSVICLFNGEVVPLRLGAVPVGDMTRGHRFLSPGALRVNSAADYREKLAAAHIVLDAGERRRIIETGLAEAAAALGATVKPDPGLLDEVTGLVECPVVLSGRIDPAFMDLPAEVLATAMRTHQKYFSCLNSDGSPAPHFLFVANNRAADGGRAISTGNERVLRARLADARFFWEQDSRVRLEERVAALKDRVFHARLGSVHDKVERIEKLAAYLADALAPSFLAPGQAGVQGHGTSLPLASRFRGNDELVELAGRAARLAKADLSTGMVGEFPELQGVMGRYYALNDGEDPRVADAIADHYKPLGPSDICPTAPVSVIVALADKIDTLAAFFAIGEPPTGSRDPFALRRAALGVIRIILENRLRLSLGQIISLAVFHVVRQIGEEVSEEASTRDLVLAFVADRLKVHLREQGVRHDLIAAVFALNEDDLVRLLVRVDALAGFLDSEDGANLLVAYRRAANIVAIEERRDACSYDAEPDWKRLGDPTAEALARSLPGIGGVVGQAINHGMFEDAMKSLATLRRPIDEFFDKVTVNCDDKQLRENRLRLLSRIRSVMNQVADFSQIEG